MMRPAFPSNRSALGFAGLLLLFLLLPVMVGKSWLPTRQQAYATQGWGWGPYPWVRNQIFEETNDIDIAFVGSSQIFFNVNTPYVQSKLSERLGRPAVVRTIAWSGGGYDALYFFTRDLLEHRHVKLLVFYDEATRGRGRNRQAPFWFRWREDAGLISGMSAANQSYYYYASIIGMPRNLLALLRPDQPASLVINGPKDWLAVADAPNPVTRLGAFTTHQGFRARPEADNEPFQVFAPPVSGNKRALIYSGETKTNFEFLSAPLPEWQNHWVGELAQLFQQHGVKPVMLALPTVSSVRPPVIFERRFWPDIFSGGISLVGVPPSSLYGSLTDAEVKRMFSDPYHCNENGQAYFTEFITPALLKLYETQSGH
jgi:hypothetical protein